MNWKGCFSHVKPIISLGECFLLLPSRICLLPMIFSIFNFLLLMPYRSVSVMYWDVIFYQFKTIDIWYLNNSAGQDYGSGKLDDFLKKLSDFHVVSHNGAVGHQLRLIVFWKFDCVALSANPLSANASIPYRPWCVSKLLCFLSSTLPMAWKSIRQCFKFLGPWTHLG